MIENIEIENFKCYQHEKIEFNHINLVSGINSSGKSTILQSILLFFNERKEVDIDLRHTDYDIDFVSFKSIINNKAENAETFKVKVNDESRIFKELIYKADKPLYSMSKTNTIDNLEDLYYISANREITADQKELKIQNNYIPNKKNTTLGQYIKQNIDELRITDFSKELDETLLEMGIIEKGITASGELGNISIEVDSIPIPNVGIGIQYVLPIIVTILTNEKINLIIENPEIHLHPKAQVSLMNFICKKCIEKEIQLFVETHSDHILNSLRLFAKTSGNFNKINVFFINEQSDIKQISINEMGKLSRYYTDFFDEIQKQVVELL